MPNIKRIVLPGEPHHITHRGNYRQKIFHLDADRRLYLDLLTDATRHFGVSIQAYCLMPHHGHPQLPSFSPTLQKPSSENPNLYSL